MNVNNSSNKSAALTYLAMVFISIVIFLVDLQFPLGVAAGVPYIAVVLLSRWLGRQSTVLVATICVTVLTIIGYFIPLPEGPLVWVGIENRLIALFAIWTTAAFAAVLIKRNEVIRQERDFNKSLVETAASIILLVDGHGKIIYFNPFTAEVSGLALNDNLGKDWIDVLVPPPERANVRKTFVSLVDRSTGRDAIFSIQTSTKETMHFSWASHVTTENDGQVASVLLIGQDMMPLVEAQQRLVQSERLAAIGETVASISHEVRNELHSMQLAVMLLETQTQDSVLLNVASRLKGIEKRLARMFEDVRGFAAPISLQRSTVSLSEIWRSAWTAAVSRYEGQAEFVEHTGSEEFQLWLDVLRVEQVFRNLFENALAVCNSPAVVTVTCSLVSRDDTPFLRISVEDNGPGLSPEVQRRLFEPFFTTKLVGTGLGMPICKRIIEAHGGDIQVGRSTSGAEFIILLPLTGKEGC